MEKYRPRNHAKRVPKLLKMCAIIPTPNAKNRAVGIRFAGVYGVASGAFFLGGIGPK